MTDLRSDTVTQPTERMREAMGRAETGDDVYGDDPTVKKLEALGAKMTGKEAALFVPSGTFGNELALLTWCPRGSEVILGDECHIIGHEAGAAALIAGVQTRCVSAPNGMPDAGEIKKRVRKRELHTPATSLICLENAHSLGKSVPVEYMKTIKTLAEEHGLPVHLDGARIFNAARALGRDARDIAACADSVMFCLSKGLCAPVGSLLAGPARFIAEARLNRKIMGGGMRQAGILAAAGLIALEEHTALLDADHARARRLEEKLGEIPGLQVEAGRDINMVFFKVKTVSGREQEEFARRGILINPAEDGTFRFVTHYWIGDAEVEAVAKAAREVWQKP